jgi:hypothetical protein
MTAMRKTSRPGHREAMMMRRRWSRRRTRRRKTSRPGHQEAATTRRWPRRRMMTMRKTSRPGHQEVVMMMTPSALSDFLESSIGSSVLFASTICISTRIVYSATSKTSSWKNC